MAREPQPPHTLGVDLGTSGCRVIVIDAERRVVAQTQRALPASREQDGMLCQDPEDWWSALENCLHDVARHADLALIRALAVDSTSGTVLLADRAGQPITPAIMYNDQRTPAIAQKIRALGGPCAAASVSSGLAKLLWLQETGRTRHTRFVLHAADWLTGRLCGQFGLSDEHNALKTGFDPQTQEWPSWLAELDIDLALLPEVRTPGELIGHISPAIAHKFGFAPQTEVHSGTTDSVAAFLASGATFPGDAVTVLGSTLVVKVLSTRPVVAPEYGIYSHRLGSLWLVGGASNSGGSALARYFSLPEILDLSPQIDTNRVTALDYYPLPGTGERFPLADPNMRSRVTPVPKDRLEVLHGLLEGMARIEKNAYGLLAELGATPVNRLYTTGGGASNQAWNAIRRRVLDIDPVTPDHAQAAYGTARLAAGPVKFE